MQTEPNPLLQRVRFLLFAGRKLRLRAFLGQFPLDQRAELA